ncbi:MAG: beta-galactosidase GalB [Chitinophagales bacterium]
MKGGSPLIPIFAGLRKTLFFLLFFTGLQVAAQNGSRTRVSFNEDWKFLLNDSIDASSESFADARWHSLRLPHDWSIEGTFSERNPATVGGGALPGGVGWYRKSFQLPETDRDKNIFIDFDGVYCNSEVWINGHYLGLRPNGYISFRYNLTPYLKFGSGKNEIAVKVDNSHQPNSRWYSGSGIFRNVWLIKTGDIHIDHWGSYITTPEISDRSATVNLKLQIRSAKGSGVPVGISTSILDESGKEVASSTMRFRDLRDSLINFSPHFTVPDPKLWSVDRPYLYRAVTKITVSGKIVDEYTTPFGIRYFSFDADNGFSLNGKWMKINGVCDHHDLGCLGSAVNKAAIRRQLVILKGMGCNAIRTSHNPPAPELLDLCDELGLLVMDEAFDMWKRQKTPFDYHLVWDEWHKKDLEDQVLRDRNHPSVIIWSIGNEIPEQWGKDSSGIRIAKELASIVRSLDTTRPITSALNHPYPENEIIRSGALDLIGYNYDFKDYANFHERFPGKKFIGTETVSAFETRGFYEMPSDSIKRYSHRKNIVLPDGTITNTISAYDNASAAWGSTHEETLREIKKHKFLSGQFIWTGFDYLGEPTPYGWPSRSSYFGIIDLAGFPKDIYYLYKSEWTNEPVLHIFPHWNQPAGQLVDVWAFYNNADEVELYLNGKSMGIRKKTGDDLHVMWRLKFEPGTLKAVSRKDGKVVLEREIKTAGKAARIVLQADKKTIRADGEDLSFITVKVLDKDGNLVPDAGQLIKFNLSDNASIAGVDNGNPVDHDSFRAKERRAFNGMCLVLVQSKKTKGAIKLTATAEGLQPATINLDAE